MKENYPEKIMNKEFIQSTEKYRTAREYPETYPGERPPTSYLLFGDRVHLMEFEDPKNPLSAQIYLPDGLKVNLNDYLQKRGEQRLEDRIAIIGYGANRCPGNLKRKLEDARENNPEKYKNVSGPMPVFRGNLKKADVAVEQFFERGYVYAGILINQDTSKTEVEAWLTLLDPMQLKIINDSEYIHGNPPLYKVAVFPGYKIDGTDFEIAPLGYAGNSKIFKSATFNSPIAFDSIVAKNRKFPEYNNVGALQLILQESGLGDSIFKDLNIDGNNFFEKTKNLMYRLNRESREGKPNKLITNKIRDYIDKHSLDFRLADLKEKQGNVLTPEEADKGDSTFSFGKILESRKY